MSIQGGVSQAHRTLCSAKLYARNSLFVTATRSHGAFPVSRITRSKDRAPKDNSLPAHRHSFNCPAFAARYGPVSRIDVWNQVHDDSDRAKGLGRACNAFPRVRSS